MEVRLYRARYGKKDFVCNLVSYEDGNVTVELAGEQILFEKKEVAQVRLYPRF